MRKHEPESATTQQYGATLEKPADLGEIVQIATMPPLLLDEATAAALLSLSPRKLWELSASGAIKCIKIGSLKRYRRVDLEEWVSSGCPTEA